jgi:hypothetical protein
MQVEEGSLINGTVKIGKGVVEGPPPSSTPARIMKNEESEEA